MEVAIVFSTPYPPEEGIGNYVDRLAQRLSDRGHDVHLVTRGGLLPSVDRRDGLTIHRPTFLPAYPFHVDVHGIFVDRTLSAIEPDLVHLHSPLAPAVDPDCPVVSTIHTSAVGDAKHFEATDLRSLATKLTTRVSSKRIIARQIDRSDVVTTVSTTVAAELEEFFGISTSETRVVGNAVDPTEFRPGGQERSEQHLLFVGRLSYRKGVEDLVDALADVDSAFSCSIVGKGPLRSELEARVREYELADRIDFLGHVSGQRLLELYQNAAVFILPSHYEGLPTVLLEAMSCGTPCIATAVSGSLDVIDDGVNGVLVDPGQPADIARAIETLLGQPDTRAPLGIAARETIEAEFTWEALADRYVDLYQEACGS